MQDEKLLSRLALLKKEFEVGQARLRELETEQAYVRETMLRISGAIQVLEEFINESKPGPIAAETTKTATCQKAPLVDPLAGTRA
jgi:predicted nuclease with TOPRIM domain